MALKGWFKGLSPVYLLVLIAFVSIQFTRYSDERWIVHTFVVLSALQVTYWFIRILDRLVQLYIENAARDPASAKSAATLITFAGRFAIVSLGLLLTLSNLGVNVTALVAGLGVGGIAVALAAQNILSDLFASLSIILDRPFVVGDLIGVDQFTGTVEAIGLKTTRVRSDSGELLIFPNASLLSVRGLRNFQRLESRQVTYQFVLAPETNPEMIRRCIEAIGVWVEKIDDVKLIRANLKALGDFGPQVEAVLSVRSGNLSRVNAVNGEFWLGLLAWAEGAQVQFGYRKN